MGIKALQYSGDVFSGVGDVFELMLSIWAMSFARIQFLSRIKSIISGLNVYTNETLKASRIPRSFRVSPIPTTSIKLCFRGALPRRNNASLLFTLEIVKFKVRSRAGASIHEKAMHHSITWGTYDLVLSATNLNAVHLLIRKGTALQFRNTTDSSARNVAILVHRKITLYQRDARSWLMHIKNIVLHFLCVMEVGLM